MKISGIIPKTQMSDFSRGNMMETPQGGPGGSKKAPRGAKNGFYHNLGPDEWIFTNFFFLLQVFDPKELI